MYRYKPHRSIAATLPRALPDAATIPSEDGRVRRRRLLPIGLAAAALVVVALLAAVPLLRRAATPAPPSAAPLDRAVVRSVAVGLQPVAMIADPRAARVVVASGDNGAGGRFSILDATTGALLTTVGLGANPSAVALDTRRGRAVVVTEGFPTFRAPGKGVFAGGALTIVDTRTGRVARAIPRGSLAVAVDEETGHIFATSPGSFMRSHGRLPAGQIAMLDENGRVLRAYFLGPYPAALAVDGPAGHVLVTTVGALPNSPGAVSVLDARDGRVVRTIPIGPSPTALVVDATRGRAFVVNNAYGAGAYLSVLDTRAMRLVRAVPLAGATTLALSARAGRVFVRTSYNTVAVLDAHNGRILKIVPVEGYTRYVLNPSDTLAVDERRGRVFVPGDRHTIVLDAATGRVLRTLAVPAELIAVNNGNGRAFTAHQDQFSPPTGGLFSRASTPTPARVSTLDLAR